MTQDSSEPINDMLSKLSANAWLGFAVVVLLLLLVLGLRNAILAALGIPISFLACFIFMHYNGESFNGNSLFGLVLVLGIIVDDAIIIVENCYRHLQLGKSWRQAAIDGTEEVTTPIFAATATTIAAFLPLILLPGIMGKFMRIVPITVSLALLASMVEAFVILPSHFADWPGRRFQRTSGPGLARPGCESSYERALRFVVRRRRWFVLSLLLVLPGAGVLVPLVGVDMFSGEEINMFQVRVTMPTGTSLETTSETLEEFERAAARLPKGEVRAVHATAGLVMTDADWIFRTDVGQLWLDLPMSYARKRSADADHERPARQARPHRRPDEHRAGQGQHRPARGQAGGGQGQGQVPRRAAAGLGGRQGQAARSMRRRARRGRRLPAGKQEVRLRIDPDKAALYGLSVAQVGLALRAALDGIKAGKMYDGDEEIDIVVRVDQRLLQRPEDLLRLPLVLPSGKRVALGDVASYTHEAQLRRDPALQEPAGHHGLTPTSTRPRPPLAEVNQALKAQLGDLGERYPGVTLDFSGEFQEFKESFTSLGQLFLFGVLLIYVILGAQFRSYIQPVVILFTVPFAFVGAMVGLVISGNPFSLITLFGMVALAGVAVNDAIVLISFVNNAKAGAWTPRRRWSRRAACACGRSSSPP